MRYYCYQLLQNLETLGAKTESVLHAYVLLNSSYNSNLVHFERLLCNSYVTIDTFRVMVLESVREVQKENRYTPLRSVDIKVTILKSDGVMSKYSMLFPNYNPCYKIVVKCSVYT